jgi:hypothetical protein
LLHSTETKRTSPGNSFSRRRGEQAQDYREVRYALLVALILAGRDDETPALLAQFEDEPAWRARPCARR